MYAKVNIVSKILYLLILSTIRVAKSNSILKPEIMFYEKSSMPSNSVLDNLFEINSKQINYTNENLIKETNDVQMNYSSDLQNQINDEETNAWSGMKTMLLQFINVFNDEDSNQPLADKKSISMLQKFVDLGDKVNFVRLVGKKINPKLVEYMLEKSGSLFDKYPILNIVPYVLNMGSTLSMENRHILKTLIIKAIQWMGQYTLNSIKPPVATWEILDFHKTIETINPLAASGLKFLLQLPDTGPEKRSMNNLNRYGEYIPRFRDTYGGNINSGLNQPTSIFGAATNIGGLTSSVTSGIVLDPYLILAGIGAAALLAFIAYRVIVTTARRKKRSDQEFDLSFIHESDIPPIMTYVYKMVEQGEDKYGSEAGSSEELLLKEINAMWKEYEDVKEGCVKCQLFDYLKHMTGETYTNDLFIAGIANLLGFEKSGHLVDEVMEEIVTQNNQLVCKKKHKTCDVMKIH